MSAVNESLKNTSEFAKRFPSKSEGIALCSVFMLSSVLIIAGSLLALVLFAVNKTLRRKSLFLVMNMAFADLMLGTISAPLLHLLCGRCLSALDSKIRLSPNGLQMHRCHFYVRLISICSLHILWEIFCCMLAVSPPITVHQNILHHHFHTLDTRCLSVFNSNFVRCL